jgi:Holliday junction DNA helicase RuvA
VIARLWGRVLTWEEESVILRVQDVGYRVHLSPHSHQTLRGRTDTSEVAMWTQYFWNEHQEAPFLAGFLDPEEQALFNALRKVPGLGPLSALRILALPVEEFVRIIREDDAARLKTLKGVGEKTARKILTELRSSMGSFERHGDLLFDGAASGSGSPSALDQEVRDVLVRQFGHSPSEAYRLVTEALRRNPAVKTTEDLFREVYRVESE